MSELQNFVRLSKYAGGRFDLAQASGGNSSVKINNVMLIKSTGCLMGDINEHSGYARIDLSKLSQIFGGNEFLRVCDSKDAEKKVAAKITDSIIAGNKPSMEILMHALLGKYVLHTHPIAVNVITCAKDWREQLKTLVPDTLFVEYATPGIALGLKVFNCLKPFPVDLNKTIVLFLQNHGLVVSGSNIDAVIKETETVVRKIEKSLGLDLNDYALTTKISEYLSIQDRAICYLCCDSEINDTLLKQRQLFFKPPFSPIMLVYNGFAPLEINDLNDKKSLQDYLQKYNMSPRVVIYDNKLFFVAPNLNHAHEMESVLKADLIILKSAESKIRYLMREEVGVFNI